MLIDTHIHLTHHLFEGEVPCIVSENGKTKIRNYNRSSLRRALFNENIACVIEPGIDLKSNYEICKVASEGVLDIYPAVGIHPTRVYKTKWKRRNEIRQLAMAYEIVAIGETGLDYHMHPSIIEKWWQKRWFKWHIRLAHELHLPLILHVRDADQDVIKILKRNKKKIHGGVCHCFNRGPEIAETYTKLGMKLGIGGSILQPGNDELVEVVRTIPLEWLLLETDGPYVKPEKPKDITKHQWKVARNTSLILGDIVAKISEIKGVEATEVESKTTENAIGVFALKDYFNVYGEELLKHRRTFYIDDED